MSRLANRFAALKSAGRKALVPYVTAGDPNPDVTLPLMHSMVRAGADVIELGVPFSDPMADGPVIQRAAERALKHHVSLRDVFDMVRHFRETDAETPVVLMGYLNPIEVMGYSVFAEQAAAAGVDGVLTVDLPPEEAAPLLAECKRHGIDPIFLLSPTTGEARSRRIIEVASGFIYYVAFKGVTGASLLDAGEVERNVAAIRKLTDLPVGVGFGIKDAESAAAMARVADAVIIGSALVGRVEALADTPDRIPMEIGAFLGELRQAMDKGVDA